MSGCQAVILVHPLAKFSRRSASEPQKGNIISSSIPSVVQMQRETFSALSVRKRGILETGPGQDCKPRDHRGAIASARIAQGRLYADEKGHNFQKMGFGLSWEDKPQKSQHRAKQKHSGGAQRQQPARWPTRKR